MKIIQKLLKVIFLLPSTPFFVFVIIYVFYMILKNTKIYDLPTGGKVLTPEIEDHLEELQVLPILYALATIEWILIIVYFIKN